MGKFQDLTGQKCGKLTVIKRSLENPANGKVKWLCQCECGNLHETISHSLTHGLCTSCGCNSPFNNPNLNPSKHKSNKYDLSGDYGVGFTTKGEEFYFDLEDYNLISGYCWFIGVDGYVVANVNEIGKKQQKIRMHRLVMNITDPKIQIDHIYHNRTDNRKSQLRIVSNSQNQMNRDKIKSNTSGTTGVYWHSKHKKWESIIGVDGKNKYLGLFDDYDQAVAVRKLAEDQYFGEYKYSPSPNN